MVPKIKVYGERNSGTKYLARLIKRNLDVKLLRGVASPPAVRQLAERENITLAAARDRYFRQTFPDNLGWKHALAQSAERLQDFEICRHGLVFVTITKNPYAWLLSLYRKPYHQAWRSKLPFVSFLTLPWETMDRENGPEAFSSPVEMWNAKNRSYLRLGRPLQAINLTYEGLLADPKQVISHVRDASGGSWKRKDFENIDRLPGKNSQSYAYYRKYYLNEEWRQHISSEALDLINERLDATVLKALGYQMIAA